MRVSTRDQTERGGGADEGFSIPAQREANKKKAASPGAIIIKEFANRGASARSIDRPQLQEMLNTLRRIRAASTMSLSIKPTGWTVI
ncbi:recombinase family protein [Sporobacter termitidis]|uniref:recombinase family protein n=1 Tax=Sporobacter termitidis TaxID=44749 RepID=UPI00093316B3